MHLEQRRQTSTHSVTGQVCSIVRDTELENAHQLQNPLEQVHTANEHSEICIS